MAGDAALFAKAISESRAMRYCSTGAMLPWAIATRADSMLKPMITHGATKNAVRNLRSIVRLVACDAFTSKDRGRDDGTASGGERQRPTCQCGTQILETRSPAYYVGASLTE